MCPFFGNCQLFTLYPNLKINKMAEIDKSIIDQINEWFYSDRNYNTGLSLLKEVITNHKGLIKTLERGDINDNMQHLTYNLFKISDHKNESICYVKAFKPNPEAKKLFIAKMIKTVNEILPSKDTEADLNFTEGSKEAKLLAKIIERQKKYYNDRAKAHKALAHHGDNNDSYSVERRKEYLGYIDELTKQVDYLHNVKQQWKQTGIMPSERVLIWEPEAAAEEKQEIIVDNIPEVDLQSELAKVRSRLSKYTKKMKDLSGSKLQAIKVKQTKDEALKAELTSKLNAVRSK